MESRSSIVIKVKFGDILRRINAKVYENELDFDMEALVSKIIDLFNFDADADLTLTYTDVDGDVVTLVDDNDLLDVMRQQLNPLRINVVLNKNNNEKNAFGRSSSRSSGSSTPMTPPSIAEITNLVAKPLRKAISKVIEDPTSSASQLAELVETFSKLGQSFLTPNAQPQDPSSSKDTNTPDAGPTNNQKVNTSNVGNKVDAPVTPVPDSVTSSVEIPRRENVPAKITVTTGNPKRRSACPYSGMPMIDGSGIAPMKNPHGHPLKSFHGSFKGLGVFHSGVQCDWCGMCPIVGTRFKSIVKENYDLCNICFSKMGKTSDYARIDRPATTFPFPHPRPNAPAPHPPQVFNYGSKPGLELYSEFVLDVSILDGTVFAPSTPFTKIWRMRNNGPQAWPQGTQLVWIGGDKFGDTVSVDTKVPANGLTVGEEIDISVDFTAPEQPGRYTSYWKMSTPCGYKFGQRVWVAIKVDAPLKDSYHNRAYGINLNLPPLNIGSSRPMDIDMNAEPIIEQQTTNKDQEEKFPINDHLLVGEVAKPAYSSSTISYPKIDLWDRVQVPPVVVPTVQASAPDVDVQVPKSSENVMEQTLLKELEQMGFKQVDLNKEVLRNNKYDLEQSVCDLTDSAKWGPFLAELYDMGFHDKARNKELLEKNDGSISRVVMELIGYEE